MKKHKVLRIVGLLVFLSGGITRAQVSTGTISGTVKDSSGAVLPGAQVVLLNEETGLSRTVVADTSGRYSAPSLSLGNYRVTATHEGFQTQARTGIVLTVGREAVVDLSLSVGSVTQTVEVTGEAPLVEATTASLGSLVDDRAIRALPLNGRSYDQLALLQPGVLLTSPSAPGSGTPQAFGTGKRFTVGGQRTSNNSFLLDGTNINDQGNGTPGGAAGTNLGVDTILEFKIFTNSFKAEFGHSSGGVITAITRSGTNTIHGTVFEYIRNSALDARNFFDATSSPPEFRRNQFGGVLGAPIKKDKTFIFGGYEGLRQGLATTLSAIVPTELAKQGILPSGKVPVNPAMLPYLNLYPLPNSRDLGNGTAQFLSSPLIPTNEDNFMVRVDHQLNAKTNIFGRYSFDTDSVNSQQNIPSLSINQATRRQFVTLQANNILTTKALNNFRFAFNRYHTVLNSVIDSSVPAQLSLVPGQPLGTLQIGATGLGAGALSLTSLGSLNQGGGNKLWAYNLFQWADDFSYSTGKHALKIGVDIQRLRDNTAIPNYVRGGLAFSSFNAFLAGTPTSITAAVPLGVGPQWGLRQSIYAVYGQDDYAVNSRLTLNIGLRWETSTDPKDANGQMSQLLSLSDPALTVTDQFFQISKKNFEPRLGLAWRVNDSGKTVVRLGGGIYHNQLLPYIYQNNIANPPFYGRLTATNPPFPNSYTAIKPGAPPSPTTLDMFQKTPTDYQYNLSIQQELLRNTVLQVAYVGNQARHLETAREGDPFTPIFTNGNLGNPFYPAGVPRLNPAFNGMSRVEMNGNSNYNALSVSLRKQSSSGFQGQISYTYSKAMDQNSGVSGSDSQRTPQSSLNPFNLRQDWARADFDATHAALASFSYPVKFRVASKSLGFLVNNWTLDGIASFQSGMPFTPRLSPAVSRDGAFFLAERPNLTPGARQNPTSGISAGCLGFPAGRPVGNATNWFDPCSFSLPIPGTYGNIGRGTIIGPGLADVDLTLEKSFKLREKANATFRFEMFNILNHANFGLPNSSPLASSGAANTSAGLITYTLTSSRQLQFALRISF